MSMYSWCQQAPSVNAESLIKSAAWSSRRWSTLTVKHVCNSTIFCIMIARLPVWKLGREHNFYERVDCYLRILTANLDFGDTKSAYKCWAQKTKSTVKEIEPLHRKQLLMVQTRWHRQKVRIPFQSMQASYVLGSNRELLAGSCIQFGVHFRLQQQNKDLMYAA